MRLLLLLLLLLAGFGKLRSGSAAYQLFDAGLPSEPPPKSLLSMQ